MGFFDSCVLAALILAGLLFATDMMRDLIRRLRNTIQTLIDYADL